MDPDLALQIDAMFSDLSSLLLAYLSDKSNCFKPLMYRIRMLGRDEASSKPWLVILCPAPVVRHAEAFFQKNQIRQFLAQIDVPGGLEVAYVGRTPKFRSGSWDDVDVAFERTDGHYGRIGSNALVLEQMSELVRATMGGVLVFKNSDGRQAIFGLTVGHLLRHEDAVEAKESTRPQEPDAESTVQAKMTREATESMIGHLAKVSFSKQARNLDWALIEFSKGVHIWRHFTPQLADEVFLLGNFYPVAATIDSTSSSANKTSSGEKTQHSTVESRFDIIEADSELPDRETEFGISQPGLELPEGKSGTWVISESHDDASAQKTVVNAHGIAIADDGYGDIYMIPLSDIMADIERVSGTSSVSLPRDTDEIARLIELEHFSLYEDAPSPTLRAPFDLSKDYRCLGQTSMARTRSSTQAQTAQSSSKPTSSTAHSNLSKKKDTTSRVSKPRKKPAPHKITNKGAKDAKVRQEKSAPIDNPTFSSSRPSTHEAPLVFTVPSTTLKSPVLVHSYTPLIPKERLLGTPKDTILFTHGAGGTLDAPAVVNFCNGFRSITGRRFLAFQGSSNLDARSFDAISSYALVIPVILHTLATHAISTRPSIANEPTATSCEN
ncbi:hypothetical protein E8E13_001425 [Curvularia kusanoi]|uniref:Uncharacterized protein n=1 Tax=Curvularia kusanoi TaxID=90978 RepID=A0A9P4T4U8_CURKU|nr:hypothetical protein E8E13_001425 [Curvularia kusanoi]